MIKLSEKEKQEIELKLAWLNKMIIEADSIENQREFIDKLKEFLETAEELKALYDDKIDED